MFLLLLETVCSFVCFPLLSFVFFFGLKLLLDLSFSNLQYWDHPCFFSCINICQIPRKFFEHETLGKCYCKDDCFSCNLPESSLKLHHKCWKVIKIIGPRQANLVLIAYASSEGSGEPAHPRSLARTFAARSYKQWIKRNFQTENQIPGPSEWLDMRSWNLSWWNARRHKFAWRGSIVHVRWISLYKMVSACKIEHQRCHFC